MPALNSLLPQLETILLDASNLAIEERARLRREVKPDGSIVTNVDRAVERFLRQRLIDLAPGTTVWGEEEGFEEAGPGGLWLVDPIDGTSNFAFGSPLWGISVGLAQQGEIVLGGISLPDLNELYLASKGGGATKNGVRLDNLKPGPIEPIELVSYCDGVVAHANGKRLPGKMRCAGAFVIDGTFVACGRYRGLIGHRERLYDVAASVLINRELGAEIRYADGAPFREADLMREVAIDRPWIIFPSDSGFIL